MMGNGEGGVYLRDQSADRSVSGGDFEGELGVSIDDPKEFGVVNPEAPTTAVRNIRMIIRYGAYSSNMRSAPNPSKLRRCL